MIDSHCHLNASYTTNTISPVLERFEAKGGKYIIDVTTNLEELSISQDIINEHPGIIYGNIGIHPESPNGDTNTAAQLLQNVAILRSRIDSLKNIVGIGETGLDYSHKNEHGEVMKKVIEQQRELFVAHISLAESMRLPLIIHARGTDVADYSAYLDVLHILEQEHFRGRVYFHSYGGSYEIAKQIFDQGHILGVNGIVTYSGAKALAEVVINAPLTSIVLETDSPFLIPSNMNRAELGSPKVNEPIGIFSTAKRIAVLKKSQELEVLETTSATALKFFERIL